jgi:hypothetical protein
MDLHAPLYLYDTTYCKGTEDSELFCPGPTGPIAASGEELLLLALQSEHEDLLCPLGYPIIILQDPVRELYELLVALVFAILDTFAPRTRSVIPRN